MLITVEYAKLHNSLKCVDTTILTAFISACSEWIERHCNRSFSAVESTEIFDGHDQSELFLTYLPAIEVSSVEFRDSGLKTFTEVDEDSYLVDLAKGVIYAMSSNLPIGKQNIRVTYTHGFAEVPSTIKEACAILCNYVFSNTAGQLKHNPALASESLGSYSWSMKTIEKIGIPFAVLSLLSSYRNIQVA